MHLRIFFCLSSTRTISYKIALNSDLLIFLAVDLVIAIVLLSAMRFISGVTANVDTTDELSKQDNFAFGISVAGSIAALGIVLNGAITGETAESLSMEIIGMQNG